MVLKTVMEIGDTDADDDGGRGAACVGHVGAVMVVIRIVFVSRCRGETVALMATEMLVGGRSASG